LWPLQTVLPNGIERFHLLDPTTGLPVAAIDYNPTPETATRTIGNETLAYPRTNLGFTMSNSEAVHAARAICSTSSGLLACGPARLHRLE
jgi:hypothetical protein